MSYCIHGYHALLSSFALEIVLVGITVDSEPLVSYKPSLFLRYKEYLTNHFQKVSINNSLSDTLPVISGDPQGSILGPILFLIYMNDISSSIWHSRLLQFADDTKCFKSISSISDQAFLQDDLAKYYNYVVGLPRYS